VQYPDNADLAAALAPGQARYFRTVFKVDWQRDGGYGDVNSDLSELVTAWDTDRQLTGNYPAELEITEGYAAAEMHVTLEGVAPDGTPVWRLFSPYSALYPGSVAATGTPCYLDLVVTTASGDVAVRQFTGYVYTGVPSRKAGTATVVIRDAAMMLAAPIDIATWGVDYFTRTQVAGGDDIPDSGTITLSSVMDLILRRSGFYQGPPWHPNALAAWTMVGSALPEVGHFAAEDPFITGAWNFGYGKYLIPQFSPASTPDVIYEPGKYGFAYKGANRIPDYSITGRAVRYLWGNAHCAQRVSPLTMGSNNSNLLGFGMWVKTGPSFNAGGFPSTKTTSLFHLEEARYDFSGTQSRPSYVEVDVDHGTGAITMMLWGEGYTKSFFWDGTIPSAVDGWHYVFCVFNFLAAAMNPYCLVDGALISLAASGSAWPPPANTYAWTTANSNIAQITARGPVQYAQWFYQYNTPLGSLIWPPSAPTNPNVKLDLSLLRLLWRPKVSQEPAWDLLKGLAAADMGALYTTEQGVVTFDNRATVKARQDLNAVTLVLTADDVEEIDPETAIESVVNTWTFALQVKHAEAYRAVFTEQQVDDFLISANSSRTQPVNFGSGLQSVRIGAVTYRPQAMGYQTNGSTAPLGGWQTWMDFYKPDYWSDGFTPYTPGSRSDPANQPVPRIGVNCYVILGWQDYTDTDPGHVRFNLTNASSSQAEFAVDDSTAFLKVQGTTIVDEGTSNLQVQDSASVTTYGIRSKAMPGGEWLQDQITVATLALSLLADTATPIPNFQALDKIGDPRTQLQDVVRINDGAGIGGPIFASVVGIKRSASKSGGIKDSLTMRTFGARGGLWILDDPGFSVLDTTTILS
jgi:hypothetical protein